MSNISKKELLELQEAREKLALLEAYGVDNWEGYSIALEGYTPVTKLYDEAEEILADLSVNCEVDYPAGHEAGAQVIFNDDATEMIVKLLKARKS